MRALVVYLLAVSSQRHGIQVHAFCAMSTHLHLVVTDPHARLPLFLAFFHRLLALATKVLRKWDGAVWDHEQTSVVRLETVEAVVDKIGYVLANPVAAGLVRRACDWPGAKSDVADVGRRALRAARPDVYLDAERGGWPAEARIELAVPPHVDDSAAWRRAVADAVREHERRALADVEDNGRKVAGVRAVLAVSPYERATSPEPLRSRNPTFAVGAVACAYSRAVAALRAFRDAYTAALHAWKRGIRDIVFPPGTYWMAHVHSVRVAT